MVGGIDSRKFTSSNVITFARGTMSWQSKLQKCVALSTTKTKFIAIMEASKELLWMKNCSSLGLSKKGICYFVIVKVLST